MNTATIKRNPEVLPESMAEEFDDARIIGVIIKLLVEPELAAAAHRLHGEHGLALVAFLLSSVRLRDLEPEKLEQAFSDRHLASTRNWSDVRNWIIDGVTQAANDRARRDPKFKESLDRDELQIIRDFAETLCVINLAGTVHIFAKPGALDAMRSK